MENETSISSKKQSQLYNDVHEEIMKSRTQVARLLNELPEIGKKVDGILSKLTFDCPEKAIAVFYKKKK